MKRGNRAGENNVNEYCQEKANLPLSVREHWAWLIKTILNVLKKLEPLGVFNFLWPVQENHDD